MSRTSRLLYFCSQGGRGASIHLLTLTAAITSLRKADHKFCDSHWGGVMQNDGDFVVVMQQYMICISGQTLQ